MVESSSFPLGNAPRRSWIRWITADSPDPPHTERVPRRKIFCVVARTDPVVTCESDANIKPSDIAFIYPGQKAVVKITAYDYSVYGGLEAIVKDISADTITNDQGESFYRVRLQRKAPMPRYKGTELEILPGMMASVDIITGKKTIMSYLLKPFTKTLNDAFHER